MKITNMPRTMEEWNNPHLIVFYGLVDAEQCEQIIESIYHCLENTGGAGGNVVYLHGEPPGSILEIKFIDLLPGVSRAGGIYGGEMTYCPECGNPTLVTTDWTDGSSSETPYCYCATCNAEFFIARIDPENSYYGDIRREMQQDGQGEW